MTTTSTSVQNDTILIEFINPLTGAIGNSIGINANNVSDATYFNLEKDYFIPSDGLTFTIEDNRVYQLSTFLQRGWRVVVSINGNLNFIGYIFDYALTYNRQGGTKVTVKCKDLLAYMDQGTCPPNMGKVDKSGNALTTNYHFPPTATLHDVISGIAQAFTAVTGGPILIQIDDSASISAAMGYGAGTKSVGKTSKALSTSYQKALGNNTMPKKGESYYRFMERIAKLAGCNIKMSYNNPNIIIVKPPTYGRSAASPFSLNHYLSAPMNSVNNILEAGYHFHLDHQPSVVIVEASTTNDYKFYQSTLKGIDINELTGFPYTASSNITSGSSVAPIPSVSTMVTNLTTGQLGTGYATVDFNDDLYALRAKLPIDIDTQVCLPLYVQSNIAHTSTEVQFAAAKILAEAQDRYCEFTFRVQGWTMMGSNPPAVWQPDMLVNVTEEIFSPGNPVTIPMWIKRVNFTLSRQDGAMTEIICTLPYTHNFSVIDDNAPPNLTNSISSPTTSPGGMMTPGGRAI